MTASDTMRLTLTPKTIRFLIRACELASGMKHDDPNDEWLYAGLATELAETYEAESERLEAGRYLDLEKEALDAATDSLDKAGRMYLWWTGGSSWQELDPIGKDEFQGVVAAIIRSYLQKARDRSLSEDNAWRGGIKSARFAAAALQDWLDTKLDEWKDLDDLPDNWDWNDVPLFEIAICELSRVGRYPGEVA